MLPVTITNLSDKISATVIKVLHSDFVVSLMFHESLIKLVFFQNFQQVV